MLHQALARSIHESKVQFVVEDTWPFRERASGQNGRLNSLRMDITTEAVALFGNHLRLNKKALLLDIAIVNPCAGSNLGNAERHVGKHLANAVEPKKTSIGARSPLPIPSFFSQCRHVVNLAQTCMPHQGACHQTGRTQVGDTLQRVPTFGGSDGSSTPSATILLYFTAGTFIPHASQSLQTEDGTCEHPTVPFARSGVCTSASF